MYSFYHKKKHESPAHLQKEAAFHLYQTAVTAVYIPKVYDTSFGQNQDHGVHSNTVS